MTNIIIIVSGGTFLCLPFLPSCWRYVMQNLRSLDYLPPCVFTSFPTASTQTLWPHAWVLAGACLLKPYHHVLSTQGSPALTLNITKHYFVNNNSKTLKKINGLWSALSWHKVYEVLQDIAFYPWAGLKVVCEERWAFSPKWLRIPKHWRAIPHLTPCVSLASPKKEFMILDTRWIWAVLFEPNQSIQMYLECWKALCDVFSKAFL